MSDNYDAIYSQDFPDDVPHGWIQWKGTDVCIDLHCECGYLGHCDREFFYAYECPSCHRKYAVGQNVKLIPLTDEQAEEYEHQLHTCELEKDDDD